MLLLTYEFNSCYDVINGRKGDKKMVGIDKLRFDKGKMTQEQLAKEIGTDQATISKWEANPLSINSRNLIKLALYFDVTIDELLGVEERKETMIS